MLDDHWRDLVCGEQPEFRSRVGHVARVLVRVRYKDWGLRLITKSGANLFLQVFFMAPCANGGEGEAIQFSRKWYISPHMTDSEIVQTAFLAIKTAEEHELREAFLFDGQRIFGPHLNITDLVDLARVSRDARGHKELTVNAE